jgi:hypothetical protein
MAYSPELGDWWSKLRRPVGPGHGVRGDGELSRSTSN